MNAAMPPAACALATACSATVVLPRRLRAVDLDDPAARQAADAERDVEGDGAGRDDLRSGARASSPRRMTEPLPNCLLDLRERRVERLVAVDPCQLRSPLGVVDPRGRHSR